MGTRVERTEARLERARFFGDAVSVHAAIVVRELFATKPIKTRDKELDALDIERDSTIAPKEHIGGNALRFLALLDEAGIDHELKGDDRSRAHADKAIGLFVDTIDPIGRDRFDGSNGGDERFHVNLIVGIWIACKRVDILNEAARESADGVDDVVIEVQPRGTDVEDEGATVLIEGARVASELPEVIARKVADARVKADDFCTNAIERDDCVCVGMGSGAENAWGIF